MNMLHELRAANIADHVGRLTDIGPRPDGSPANQEAVKYIVERMQLFGLQNVELFPVTVPVVDNLETGLRVVSPIERGIRCLPNMRPGLTPPGGITRPIVFAGKGFEADFAAINCVDKIALCFEERPWEGESEDRPRYALDRTQNAWRAGASAVVMSDKRDDDLITTWALARDLDNLPSVCISYPDFLQLREACAAEPVQAWLRVFGDVRTGQTHIVSGIVPGETDRQIIIVGSHHETNPGVPGANNSASGLSVMLELARFFAQHRSKSTIQFVATGGEESGHWANAEWLEANLQQLKSRTKAVIVLAAIGVPNVAVYGTKWNGMTTDRSLNQVMSDSAGELGYFLPLRENVPFLSDATEYLKHGIPATLLCSRVWDRFLKTARDTADNISANHLKAIADIVAYAVMQLDQRAT